MESVFQCVYMTRYTRHGVSGNAGNNSKFYTKFFSYLSDCVVRFENYSSNDPGMTLIISDTLS